MNIPEATNLEKMTGVQRGLAALMSEISERHYAAGWISGLESALWSMVALGARDFGLGEVSKDEVRQLRELSMACGGWIVWRNGETFVTIDEWRAMNFGEAKVKP